MAIHIHARARARDARVRSQSHRPTAAGIAGSSDGRHRIARAQGPDRCHRGIRILEPKVDHDVPDHHSEARSIRVPTRSPATIQSRVSCTIGAVHADTVPSSSVQQQTARATTSSTTSPALVSQRRRFARRSLAVMPTSAPDVPGLRWRPAHRVVRKNLVPNTRTLRDGTAAGLRARVATRWSRATRHTRRCAGNQQKDSAIRHPKRSSPQRC